MSAAARDGRRDPRLERGLAALAALGVGGLAFAIVAEPRRALVGWLTAFAITLTVVLGALALHVIGLAARASWLVTLRRPLEAIVATLPLQALFFLPIALFARHLYPWAMAPAPLDALGALGALDADAQDRLAAKRAWLNLPAFLGRAALCFAIWIAVAALLRRASRRQDAGDPRATASLRAIAGLAMPPLAITLTIAAFDWLMSIEPAWVSNAYGVYVFVGAFAAAVALVAALHARAPGVAALTPKVAAAHAHALGNLLLAAVILWAYIAFTQLLILWIADRPDEIVWYLARVRGGFGWLALALALAHFALPFAALLLRGLKRRPRPLAAIASVALIGHALDLHWLVAPAFEDHLALPWRALCAIAVTGSLTALAALRALRARAAAPIHDPDYGAALRFSLR